MATTSSSAQPSGHKLMTSLCPKLWKYQEYVDSTQKKGTKANGNGESALSLFHLMISGSPTEEGAGDG